MSFFTISEVHGVLNGNLELYLDEAVIHTFYLSMNNERVISQRAVYNLQLYLGDVGGIYATI